MNDNNKEITEEALDILYSFEEPLEQHIRSKYSELNFDCILLGAIYSKTKETSEASIIRSLAIYKKLVESLKVGI